jgi:hypothetical protein
MRGRRLAANILLDVRRVAEVAPVGRELRTQPLVPGEMIRNHVDIEEERPAAAFATDQFNRLAVIETVGLEIGRTEVLHVKVTRNTGRGLNARDPIKEP